MKFVGLIAFAAAADALHKTCTAATVAADTIYYNTTLPAHTMAADSTDAAFVTLCGNTDLYQDFFWSYTATCTGAGLVSFWGNENVSSLNVAITTGTCTAPTLAGQSTSGGRYLAADMTTSCGSASRSTDTITGMQVQKHQFVAVLGTTYTIAAGRAFSQNITGNNPGEEYFQTLIQCSPPASTVCDTPTVVTEGLSSFSNIGGVANAATDTCTGGKTVFLEYEATCTGSVNFTMLGGAGYQREDLEMGIYTGCGGDADLEVCQDDPAVVYANASADPDLVGRNQGLMGGGSMGGVSSGSKYLVKVGAWSSAESPFVFFISACMGDGSSTSGAATVAAPLVALAAMFFF